MEILEKECEKLKAEFVKELIQLPLSEHINLISSSHKLLIYFDYLIKLLKTNQL